MDCEDTSPADQRGISPRAAGLPAR